MKFVLYKYHQKIEFLFNEKSYLQSGTPVTFDLYAWVGFNFRLFRAGKRPVRSLDYSNINRIESRPNSHFVLTDCHV